MHQSSAFLLKSPIGQTYSIVHAFYVFMHLMGESIALLRRIILFICGEAVETDFSLNLYLSLCTTRCSSFNLSLQYSTCLTLQNQEDVIIFGERLFNENMDLIK